ncbi:MAG: hypothetical protein AAGA48_33350 [Myxococcota bacterium]
MVRLVLSLVDFLGVPIEDRLQQELQLADVDVTMVEAEGFAVASLEDRLALLREREVASPAAWITLKEDTVQVSLATFDSDRANVRLVAVPSGPDAPAELALGIREILTQLAPPPLAGPEPRSSLHASVGLGAVVPTQGLALGPRLLLQAEGTWSLGSPASIGGMLAVQLGRDQWRVGLGAVGRYGPGLVAARLDVARLPWVTWLQPRLDIGATITLSRFWAEPRLSWAPQRDIVQQRTGRIYDSGRIEFVIAIGLRQMPAR